MSKRSMKKLILSIVFVACLVPITVLAADVTVTPQNMEGWFVKQGNKNATGQITAVADDQGGNGSFEFHLNEVTNGSGAIFQIARVPAVTPEGVTVVKVDDIEELSWSFMSDTSGSYGPKLKVEYWGRDRLGNMHSGTLVYAGPLPAGAGWHAIDVDFNSDPWWSTENDDESETHPFAYWQNLLSGVPINYLVAGIGSTSGNMTAATTHIDYIHFKEKNGIDDTWNFETGGTPPSPETVVVTPDDTQGWALKRGNRNASGQIADVPDNHGGQGSFEFKLDGSTDGSGSIFQIARIPVLTVDSIAGLSWDYKSDPGNGAYPVIKIEYWSSERHGSLVYIPAPASNPGSWETVTVDFDSDLWWSTELGHDNQRTLAEWQQELGGILVNYLVAGLGSTSGNPAASTSYIDYIRLVEKFRGTDTTWDFEGKGELPPPVDPPIPTLSEWGVIILSLLLTGYAWFWRRRESVI